MATSGSKHYFFLFQNSAASLLFCLLNFCLRTSLHAAWVSKMGVVLT